MSSERFYDRLAEIDRASLLGPIKLPSGMTGTISGAGNDFATFTDHVTGLSCEYAWQTVQRIRSTQ